MRCRPTRSTRGAYYEGSGTQSVPRQARPGTRLAPGTFADRHRTGRPRQRHRPPGVGVVLLADLDHVDGPRESRLVGVRWVATDDEHAPRGIEPALDVVVHVLASRGQLSRRYVPPTSVYRKQVGPVVVHETARLHERGTVRSRDRASRVRTESGPGLTGRRYIRLAYSMWGCRSWIGHHAERRSLSTQQSRACAACSCRCVRHRRHHRGRDLGSVSHVASHAHDRGSDDARGGGGRDTDGAASARRRGHPSGTGGRVLVAVEGPFSSSRARLSDGGDASESVFDPGSASDPGADSER